MRCWNKLPWVVTFALLVAIGVSHWDWIKKILGNNNAPAWAQVVSALIAVLAAIWISRRDVHYRKNAEAAAAKRAKDIFISHNKALIKSDLVRLNSVAINLQDFSNPKKDHALEYRRFFVNIGNVYFLRLVDVAGSYDVHGDLPNEIIEAKILLMHIYRDLENIQSREDRIMDDDFTKKKVKSQSEMESDYLDYAGSDNRRLSDAGIILLNKIVDLKSSFERISNHLC